MQAERQRTETAACNLCTCLRPLQLPPGFNTLRDDDTERMIQYHIASGSSQLQQLYWGIMAAVALGRTLVLPAMHCFCARNWCGHASQVAAALSHTLSHMSHTPRPDHIASPACSRPPPFTPFGPVPASPAGAAGT